MRNYRKVLLIVFVLLLISIVLGGCAVSQDSVNTEERTIVEESVPEMDMNMASEESGSGSDWSSPLEPEKVITTIDLGFETTDFDETIEELEKKIESSEGYIENSEINYNARNYRNAHYVIRIPKANLQKFKTDLDDVGNKTRESISKDDVTKHYTDTESRVNVLEVKEERLLSLLKEANEIEDIIQLEDQLSEVIYEKEQLQSNLLDIDDMIEYNTIYLYISEVDKYTSATSPDTSFGEKISDALGDSVYFFKDALENLVILFIYVVPFLVVFGILGYLLYRLRIKYKKNKDDK